MSFTQTYRAQGGTLHDNYRPSFIRNKNSNSANINDNRIRSYNPHDFSRNFRERSKNYNYVNHDAAPSLKRRKFSASAWEDTGRHYQQQTTYDNAPSTCNSLVPAPTRPNANAYTSTSCKRDRSKLEDDDMVFMSRDEIERCSPSRKDGIDALREMHLRYSYCAFLQNLGLRLELPQTTIGTAMVLCHRFFVRRSHACHDRFLIATASLFLAAKSEETQRPLNNVVRASCEILHKLDLTFLSYLLPVHGYASESRLTGLSSIGERVIEAEQMILTTLDFELTVEHPYVPLTSVLNKLVDSEIADALFSVSVISIGLVAKLVSRI
ncbi:Cyclin-T1-4 [Vitis vinifera]|uniref:Cyclin-T1-4 n=1 Tax=Vitis vinifera TaxID=29760 RepID=A0A438KLP1_VITVI|nr:Cyclin-T1-4 [Vitis vinifera]